MLVRLTNLKIGIIIYNSAFFWLRLQKFRRMTLQQTHYPDVTMRRLSKDLCNCRETDKITELALKCHFGVTKVRKIDKIATSRSWRHFVPLSIEAKILMLAFTSYKSTNQKYHSISLVLTQKTNFNKDFPWCPLSF